jgi:hypothetical protein
MPSSPLTRSDGRGGKTSTSIESDNHFFID